MARAKKTVAPKEVTYTQEEVDLLNKQIADLDAVVNKYDDGFRYVISERQWFTWTPKGVSSSEIEAQIVVRALTANEGNLARAFKYDRVQVVTV